MIEQVQHQDAEYRDCEQTGDARNGIVNSRCDAYAVSRDGVHNNGSQGRHAYCHTETKHSDCREKPTPIVRANLWNDKKSKADCGDDRTDNQWKSAAIAFHKSAGPA